MNTLKKLIASLLFAMISTTTFAETDAQVFAYAEAKYPTLFNGGGKADTYEGYSYSYYPATGNYLAVKAGTIYILGRVSGGTLVSIGTLASFAKQLSAFNPNSLQK